MQTSHDIHKIISLGQMVSFGVDENLTSYNATSQNKSQNLQSVIQNLMQHFFKICPNYLLQKDLHVKPFYPLKVFLMLKCTSYEPTLVSLCMCILYMWINSRIPIFCKVQYKLFILMELSQLTFMSSTFSTWRVRLCVQGCVPVNYLRM